VCLIVLFSCESKVKYKEPDNLIAKEQMIDLLIDMHIASASSGVRDKTDNKDRNYMSLVYEKYQIDSTRFAESNFYYVSNIKEYEAIFKEVQKQLKEIQDKYTITVETESQKDLDSIREKQKIPKKLGEKDIFK
jgi:hypothetical protein